MSLNVALTGILASNTDLGVISDNIANAATTGFKKSRAEFGDLVDSMSAQGSGLGVRLQKITQSFKQGSIETTDNTFDMAVVGDGFFQVKSGTETFYTRAGSFHPDTNGFIVNNLKQNVQGYQVQVSEPTASSEVSLGISLDGTSFIRNIADFDPTDPLTYNNVTTVTLYDSKGFPHTLRSYFLKTTDGGVGGNNDWQAYHQLDNNPEIIDGKTVTFDNATGLTSTNNLINEFPPVELGTGADRLSILFNYKDLTQGSAFNTFSLTVNGSARSRELTKIVGDLQLESSMMEPKMTRLSDVGVNLNAKESAPIPTVSLDFIVSFGADTVPPLVSPFDSADPATYNHVTSQQIYDTLGVNHTLKAYFVRNGTNWDAYYTLNDTYQKTGGTITFDGATGLLDPISSGTITTPITFSTAELGTGAPSLSIIPTFNRSLEVSGDISTTTSVLASSPAANPSTIDATDPRNYHFPTSLSIYDSLGIDHTLNLYFRKVADNSWSIYRQFSEVESIAQRIGTISFDTNGVPTRLTDEKGYSDPDEPLTLRMPSISFGNGAGRQNIRIDFSETTQFDSKSVINSLGQDGYTMGEFSRVEADESGNLVATYSNNQTQVMGQVVLARFANNQGLKRQGDNNWVSTSQSGQPIVGAPGSGSAGNLVVGALEGSNVELTRELVDMITAQRGFQANAQVITTTGTLYQAVLQIR